MTFKAGDIVQFTKYLKEVNPLYFENNKNRHFRLVLNNYRNMWRCEYIDNNDTFNLSEKNFKHICVSIFDDFAYYCIDNAVKYIKRPITELVLK